jgi:hypothetical protein
MEMRLISRPNASIGVLSGNAAAIGAGYSDTTARVTITRRWPPAEARPVMAGEPRSTFASLARRHPVLAPAAQEGGGVRSRPLPDC